MSGGLNLLLRRQLEERLSASHVPLAGGTRLGGDGLGMGSLVARVSLGGPDFKRRADAERSSAMATSR